jgi:hypothetical protein
VSQHLKDKILNYEVAPPKGMWDSIAFELDKDDSTLIIAKKLGNYEVNPPAMVWGKIEEALDKESNNTLTVSEKLGNFEIAPPAKVWNKIEAVLDKEGTKVIELKPKVKVFNFYKLAAAASVLLIITTSVWIFTNNNKPAIENPIVSNTIKPNNTSSVTPNNTNGSSTLLTPDIQEKNTKTNNTASVQKEKVFDNSKEVEIAGTNPTNDLSTNPFASASEKLVAKNGDVPENIDLVSTPNTYLTIVGPDGQSIRVSSKFSKQLGLFTERDPDKMENIDFIIKESAMWRNKIAGWRKKMNIADVSPSLHNFMDIIELSKKIDSDKKK